MAASRTVEGREPHSLHAYFLLPGDMAAPIVYEVERIRDGRSFATRRVQAIQHGRPIFSMLVSFQSPEKGFEHQSPMPDVPPPQELPSFADLRAKWLAEATTVGAHLREALNRPLALDFRPVEPGNPLRPEVASPVQHVWFKTVEPVPPDPMLHRCLLAYASDFNLIGTALRPHGFGWYTGTIVMASLDHAIWFHRDLRVDEWLLYSMDSPTAQGARGLARGLIHDAHGKLVASVVQEGMMRLARGATV
jgi:acyl-CoA thioesterase-2